MKKARVLLYAISVLALAEALIVHGTVKLDPSLESNSSNSTSILDNISSNQSASQEESGIAAQSAAQSSAASSSYYVIREYNGHIAVYENDSTVPFEEFQTEVDVLPDADQKELEDGIVVNTMTEVRQRVEDFDG